MEKLTKAILDKLTEARECSRETHSLTKRLAEFQARAQRLQSEVAGLFKALGILQATYPELEAEVRQAYDLDLLYRQELNQALENGVYPEPETPAKPASLAEIIQEIAASLEGEFTAGDVRKLLSERDPELHGKSHAASITTALARLAKDGILERVSGGGRGKESIFRRKA